jgi:coenzyme F420-reducing hydrogenase gamma subunit
MKNVPKVAIFDLTDCEGCELQFIALRKALLDAGHEFEITNWRLGTAASTLGPFDVTFIEGSPISESDIELVKQARKKSGAIVSLGSCAALGGVQSALPENQRAKMLQSIYKKSYKSTSKAPKPLSYYIDVDIHLPGCPVNPNELAKLLSCVFAGKDFKPATAPVCLDCKADGNTCLFVDEGFCLGPVTKGGCEAPCPKRGLRCYGCFGPLDGANLFALEPAAKHKSKDEIDKALKLFFKHSDQYKDYKTKEK